MTVERNPRAFAPRGRRVRGDMKGGNVAACPPLFRGSRCGKLKRVKMHCETMARNVTRFRIANTRPVLLLSL